MEFRKHEVVKVSLPGTPIDGRRGTILGRDLRDGHWYYAVDVDGEDCSWMLPENSLQPTGETKPRQRGWNGCKYDEGDRVEVTTPNDSHLQYKGHRGTIYSGKKQSEICWYTVELDNGQILLLQENEFEMLEPEGIDGPG